MINEKIALGKEFLKDMVSKLKGHDKRVALAQIANEYGTGGQTFVAELFGVSRTTIRKGNHELRTGIKCEDAFHMRGRDKTTKKLPNLEQDLKNILDSQSQTDPSFKTTRLYTKLTIKQLRLELLKLDEYTEEKLPCDQTLTTIVNTLGFTVKKVQKTKPLKKISETNQIFENLKEKHKEIESDNSVVRLSIDTKDRVKIGDFSRGGKNRVVVKAMDHDFGSDFVVPFGIYNVKDKSTEISLTETKVTADFMVDQLEAYWTAKGYDKTQNKLVINADNGPENSGRRTQWIKRMVEFSAKYDVEVTLAYYPPYHSKYNPVERVWGRLEQHWNGDLLDSVETVVKMIETMDYEGQRPSVHLIEKVYESGKKVAKDLMMVYEKAIERKENIEKWYMTINPLKSKEILKSIEALE